jgi:hypothetical protein
MWMAGYAARNKPSEGTLHDLFAKALALESSGGGRLVIVTCDLIGINASLADRVAGAAQRRFGLARPSLLLNASHTHCGPELRPERTELWGLPAEQGPRIARYIARLERQLVDLIGAALSDMQPAQLAIGQASCGFARNRRFPTEKGYVNRQYDDGPVDHDVPVLAVTALDGGLRAVVFSYACHNTTLSFYKFCGDYAGFAQLAVEKAHPGATALFVTGAGGDQNPYPRGTVELCQQHGTALADAVARALAGKQQPIRPKLSTAFDRALLEFAPLPPIDVLRQQLRSDNAIARRKAQYLLSMLEKDGLIDLSYRCPVQAIRLGDEVLWIAIGGEVVVDYSRRLKREYQGPVVWVAGYSNDVFGYLPSLRVLREGGYEAGGAMLFGPLPGPFAESVEERILATVARLVKPAQASASSR